ncbi:ABC transporter substrate-binding protein [Pseudooceanicola sp. CBS1P-1]|uniref:Probable sugar-binding periplasmic protein n=1 Tax=Pseudooceanicola albus TaxID=2692189 RepID=A0A6L7G839_9RHOB|nr:MULTISPECIES: ABC transporter substrate-binding protein [Pseudooceanicola]MBT9385288.1 ABC transporter substrate-binding protein [Pseudooceanicola endophyticus]MXN18853.1 extracellular solute-binding protein [Pseudooceanicola albus]
MTKRKFRSLLLGAVSLATLAAPLQAQDLTADVMHWWNAGNEAEGVKVLAKAYDAAGGTWVDRPVPGMEAAMATGISAVVSGTAPAAMQFNINRQLKELAASGMLSDVTDYAKRDGWIDQVPQALLKSISVDGHIYALPVVVQNYTTVWTVKSTFEKAGVTYPKTWDDFMASLEAFKKAGIIPLAKSGEPWSDMLFVQAIMLFSGHRDMFDALFTEGDIDKLNSPAFLDVARTIRQVVAYTDPGAPSRTWDQADTLLVQGKAAYTFMGDWAKGSFTSAGLTPGQDFTCELGIGKNQFFVLIGDTFVLPKNAKKTEAQSLFAKVVMDAPTQVDFTNARGGKSPRLDAVPTQSDGCTDYQQQFAANGGTQLMNTSAEMSGDRFGAVNDAVSQYINTPSMTPETFQQMIVQAIESTE